MSQSTSSPTPPRGAVEVAEDSTRKTTTTTPSSEGGTDANAPDMDIMIRVFLQYSGTAKLTMQCLVSLVNWPRPRTVCLPVTFTLSNFHFEGVACAIHHMGKVYFCFDKQKKEGADSAGPLKSIKIDAEIGDSTQQVLKNLDQVENFIVSMLQKLIRDRLVYPQHITILDTKKEK